MDIQDFDDTIAKYGRILDKLEGKPATVERELKLMGLGFRILGEIERMSWIAWTARGRSQMVPIRDRAYALCKRIEALGFVRVGDPQEYHSRDASGVLYPAGRYA